MIYNDHSKLKGSHAFLSASKYYWLNYDADKLVVVYNNLKNQEMGTKLHEFAANCIDLGQRLPDEKKTINMYVNDAIGYKMKPEQILYYSDNCYATTLMKNLRERSSTVKDAAEKSNTFYNISTQQ